MQSIHPTENRYDSSTTPVLSYQYYDMSTHKNCLPATLLPIWHLHLRSADLLPGAGGVPATAGCGLCLGDAGWLPGLAAAPPAPSGLISPRNPLEAAGARMFVFFLQLNASQNPNSWPRKAGTNGCSSSTSRRPPVRLLKEGSKGLSRSRWGSTAPVADPPLVAAVK